MAIMSNMSIVRQRIYDIEWFCKELRYACFLDEVFKNKKGETAIKLSLHSEPY